MLTFMQRLPAFLLIVTMGLSLSACAQAATLTPEPIPVSVQLSWTHQAQFAGFYAADQQGYYAAEGLAVTFVEGGPSVDTPARVADKTAQFGAVSADVVLLKRAEGMPLKAIAIVYRRNPRVYMALTESGISRPQDFVGKTIAMGRNGQPLLDAMMLKLGLDPSQYTVVEAAPDMEQLYSGQVQVRSVFLTNEVLAAQAAGYQFNLILPDDYGIHFYNQAIVTSDELIASQPDLVRRFLRASLKGWRDAVENPDKAGQWVAHYDPKADLALENEKMSASMPLINTGEDELGWMKPDIWAGMIETLRSQKVITQPLTADDVYTMQFLNVVYPK